MISNIDLQNEMISQVKSFISTLTENDIYAISFELDTDKNPCDPSLGVGYNTETNFKDDLVIGYDLSIRETRWNCAYWAGDNFFHFGDGKNADSVKQWIIDMGLPYLTYEEFFKTKMSIKDFEARIDKYSVIEIEFMKIVVSVIKHLHESGFIKNKFGKNIPLIIYVHGDGCNVNELIAHNIEANGLPLAQEFIDFLENVYHEITDSHYDQNS